VFSERHGFKDSVSVTLALDNSMGFVGVQLFGRLVNGRASVQENLPVRSDIFGVPNRLCGVAGRSFLAFVFYLRFSRFVFGLFD